MTKSPCSPLFIAVPLLLLAVCPPAAAQHADIPTPEWAFSGTEDVEAWQDTLRSILAEKLALPPVRSSDVAFEFTGTEEAEDYVLQHLVLRSDAGEAIPGYLLKPKHVSPPYPVMITLQGHSPGMHISIGRAYTSRDSLMIAGGRDIALQAVRNGWAALVIEQKGFGKRAVEGVTDNDLALRELLVGRNLTGQRVADVMSAVDFIETQPDLDADRIGSMGNSTGGTVSFYAAAIDPRIRLAVVSSSFSTYARSWLKYPHCACGYIAGIMETADMGDLAGLIAPRHLVIIAGKEDYIADIEGAREGFEQAKKVFSALGVPDHIRLLEGDGGHRFYPALTWPVVDEIRAELASLGERLNE